MLKNLLRIGIAILILLTGCEELRWFYPLISIADFLFFRRINLSELFIRIREILFDFLKQAYDKLRKK